MIRLTATYGQEVWARTVRGGERFTVGSCAGSAWRLPIPGVSRRHATVRGYTDHVVLRDQGSKNGLVADGERRQLARLIPAGQPLQIGRALVRLERLPSSDAELAIRFESGIETGAEQVDRLTATEDGASQAEPSQLGLQMPEEMVLGPSEASQKLLRWATAAASSRLNICITGESGVGKELVARTLHESGNSARGPYVAINCAAISASLLEAELFGVARGAATGATARQGFFARASGGTLVLDEVGEMPPAFQVTLLRALQEREVYPVGATEPIAVDFNLISMTQRKLEEELEFGRFRPDLYQRLSVMEYEVPPLRARREDVGLLAHRFAERRAIQLGKTIKGISRRALGLLEAPYWSGNVRQLRNVIEAAVTGCPAGRALEGSDLEPFLTKVTRVDRAVRGLRHDAESDCEEARTLAEIEEQAIRAALRRNHGNKSKTARQLGVSRQGLRNKIERFRTH